MTKIAFIGAGSFGFTRKLVRDVLTFPRLDDICTGMLLAGFAQIPLTLTNAVIAPAGLIRDYFPGREVSERKLLFNMGVMNAIGCLFGGMPCTTRPDGNLDYSHDAMDLLNVAVARLNMWVTQLPTVQSGGSTGAKIPDVQALADGIRGRRILCDFGVHNARHCFGVLDNLNFFSEKAFLADCQAQREYLQHGRNNGGLKPLYLPADDQAFDVIERVGSSDYHVDYHTTANLDAFDAWARVVADNGIL